MVEAFDPWKQNATSSKERQAYLLFTIMAASSRKAAVTVAAEAVGTGFFTATEACALALSITDAISAVGAPNISE